VAVPDEALEEIESQVAHAYYDADEILESVLSFYPDETDEDAVRGAIAEAFARRAAEIASWPAVTDCDRLFAAFAELERAGIIALENCGTTLQDGLGFVEMIADERRQTGWIGRGYCFFHEQDVMHAIDGDGLLLAFGALDDDSDEAFQRIGEAVAQACKAQRLAVRWSGSVDERIRLPELQWQCRPRKGNRPPRPE